MKVIDYRKTIFHMLKIATRTKRDTRFFLDIVKTRKFLKIAHFLKQVRKKKNYIYRKTSRQRRAKENLLLPKNNTIFLFR